MTIGNHTQPVEAQRMDTLRSKIPRLVILLIILAVGISSLSVLSSRAIGRDDDSKKKPNCRYCKDQGWTPCKRHPKGIHEMESGAIRCSENIRCKKCRGTLKLSCTRCDINISEQLAEEREANLKWLLEMNRIDEIMKTRNIMHCESAHIKLTYNIPRISVGKQGFKTHGGMHLYLRRMEECYEQVCKDLGATDKDFLAKTHVMMWEREAEVVRSASVFCRQKSNTKSYLLGAAPIFTIYYNKGFLHEEYELHQAVVHNVVHCLLSNVWDGIWPGNIRGGWLDAGFAHHYELQFKQYGGGVRNYCYREGDTSVSFKFGRWESSVRRAVDKGKAPSFLGLSTKNIDMLEPQDHMFSWSYVDFILKTYPDRFGQVARLIKQQKPIAEVMKKSLDMTPFQFEAKWKEYVQSKYSPKEQPWGKPTGGKRR